MLAFTLKKRLRHFTLDLSMKLGAETMVLIGPSGCGKSTTLRMLAGLLDADEGRIELDGRLLLGTGGNGRSLPPEERNVGLLVQSYALFPHLSVTENVAYGVSGLYREDRLQRVEESLSVAGIRHLASAMPGDLSGGEQQRAALARALARRPDFLLLDEPLSALDVSTRGRVRSELALILQRLSIPAIVVTHDYEDARILGDRIAVMDRGGILQSGTAEEISARPADPFVAAFTDTNLLPAGDSTIAFDPWDVTVSRASRGGPYEWRGLIRDLSTVGPFTRLNIETEHAPQILADVPAFEMESEGFRLGEEVYAGVAPDDARPVDSPASPASRDDGDDRREEPAPLRLGRTGVVSGFWGVALIAVLLLGAVGAYAAANVSGGGAGATESVRALVAANMTDANGAVAEEFERRNEGVEIESSYAGTQILFTQLEQGVTADFFISADKRFADEAVEQGLTDSYEPVSQMNEVIIVPDGNPADIQSLEDLGEKPVDLVIGVENVPIGRYTREIFENAGEDYGQDFSETVLEKVVSNETNTREVAQKVATGDGEAAVIYRTDVTPDIEDRVEVIQIPEEYNVLASNYAAVPNDAPNPELAREYLEFMASDEGQEILRRFGYEELRDD